MTWFEGWESYCREKVVAPDDLEARVLQWRAENKTLASLNGSFDLLHAGHLAIIGEAARVADILIVALNSDHSIRGYKGEGRPIIPLEYRMQMMAAVGFVDYVTWFDDPDPCRILAIIKPDVHVNGSEYGKDCIEAPVVEAGGGRVHIVDLVFGLSTTNIINKIREQCD